MSSGLPVPQLFDEMWSRNEDILAPNEQAALQAATVLCAGCGTVGGSVAEPLARMGVCAFVLADPEVYDVTNLNRQTCVLADVGRPKVEVTAERIRAVNPHAQVVTMAEGLTPENIAGTLERVTVVFEGVDAFTSLWVKYLVHREAARRRIPVLSGVDYGGQPTVYVWDYRRDPRPFYGSVSEQDHREGRTTDALGWLGYRHFPGDFVPVIVDRLGSERPWPQVAYCADGLGAIGSRTIIDVISGHRVRDVVKADLHDLTRTPAARLVARARWPLIAARALATVRGPAWARRRAAPSTAVPDASLASLSHVLDAMRRAPSVHNTQPWRLSLCGVAQLRLRLDGARSLSVIDSGQQGACYSLGCAIEAANAISEVAFDPEAVGRPTDGLWDAGRLEIGEVREAEYARNVGLIRWRRTNRAPFHSDSLERHTLQQLSAAASAHAVSVTAITERAAIQRLAALTADATVEALEEPDELDELLRWIRIGRRSAARHSDGFTERTLQIDPATAMLVSILQRSMTARRIAARAGLARVMSEQARSGLEAAGAVLLFTHGDTSPVGCISAGRGLMAAWLAATAASLGWQPVNQALVLDRRTTDVLELFGASTSERPMAIVRVGRVLRPAPAAPRLPLERIVEQPPVLGALATSLARDGAQPE